MGGFLSTNFNKLRPSNSCIVTTKTQVDIEICFINCIYNYHKVHLISLSVVRSHCKWLLT